MGLVAMRIRHRAPVGERHDPVQNNPVVIGVETIGPAGFGAPNRQLWQRPSRLPEPGLEQGAGVGPGREWQHTPVYRAINPAWARNLGVRLTSLATVRDPARYQKPEWYGWTGSNYIQEWERRRRPTGPSTYAIPDTEPVPFNATRLLWHAGGGAS